MLKAILLFLAPLRVVASELTAIRELYEAELALHDPPIYRVTEKPKSSDTEVYMPGAVESPKYKRWEVGEVAEAADRELEDEWTGKEAEE